MKALVMSVAAVIALCGAAGEAAGEACSGDAPELQRKAPAAAKAAFIEFLACRVDVANERVFQLRQQVLQARLEHARGVELGPAERDWLSEVAEDYGLPLPRRIDNRFFEVLLKRVDVLPASLVVAQAANESAWGTSRFVRDAKNYFGVWCYSPGCGIVPSRRQQGERHEVKRYASAQESVDHFLNVINSGRAFADLRDTRAASRARNEPLDSMAMARGLKGYSQRREVYVQSIVRIIEGHNLVRYDKVRPPASSQSPLTTGKEN